MRYSALICCALLAAACAKKEAPAVDTTPAMAPAPVAPPAPVAIDPASLVGTWDQVVTAEGSDSVLVKGSFVATADPKGWKLTLPNRPAMAERVTIAGDSVVSETGPYSSVLRKGVMVTTNTVMHMQDGKLVGTTIAHYKGDKTADSVRTLHVVATKRP